MCVCVCTYEYFNCSFDLEMRQLLSILCVGNTHKSRLARAAGGNSGARRQHTHRVGCSGRGEAGGCCWTVSKAVAAAAAAVCHSFIQFGFTGLMVKCSPAHCKTNDLGNELEMLYCTLHRAHAMLRPC